MAHFSVSVVFLFVVFLATKLCCGCRGNKTSNPNEMNKARSTAKVPEPQIN